MSELVRHNCPHCQHGLDIPVNFVGRQGKCPKCGEISVIGGPAADAPVQPPPSSQPDLPDETPVSPVPADMRDSESSSAPGPQPEQQAAAPVEATEEPSVGDAARGLFKAVASKVKDATQRLQTAAGQNEESPSPAGESLPAVHANGATPSTLPGRLQSMQKKDIIKLVAIIFGGMLALSLVASIILLATGGMGRFGTAGDNGQPSSTDNGRVKKGTLASFDDHPPPVLQAVRDGSEVFELKSYMSSEDDYIASAIHQYLVYKDGQLVAVCEKIIVGKGLSDPNPNEGDFEFSYDEELTSSDESGRKDNHEGKKVGDNEYEYKWLYQFKGDTFISTTNWDVQVFQDPEFGEGHWTRRDTSVIDYRGRMGDMPDQREEKSSRGAAIPVKLP